MSPRWSFPSATSRSTAVAVSDLLTDPIANTVSAVIGSRVPKLTRSERRSWQLHRRLSTMLDRQGFENWQTTIERNLDRLDGGVTGQPHERNLDRWRQLVDRGDVPGLHRVLTGLDRDSIEMREVSPMSGLLPDE